MSASPGRSGRLERRYRRLLRWYPAAWRRHREDEMVATLLDQAEGDGRTRVGLPVALDLVGHGLEERVERWLRAVPRRLREQTALLALVAASVLAAVLLAGELIGARYQGLDATPYYFTSGPVLSLGAGLYPTLLAALVLVVVGRGGAARVTLVAAVGLAVALRWPLATIGLPVPRLVVLTLLAGLAALAALATLRVGRRAARRLVGWSAVFLISMLGGIAVSQPLLGWSVGTMATSSNIALVALAAVLPVVGGGALVVAAVQIRRHPGWLAAGALAAFPVILFCTLVALLTNPSGADTLQLIPLGYVAVVGAVALGHRHGVATQLRSG